MVYVVVVGGGGGDRVIKLILSLQLGEQSKKREVNKRDKVLRRLMLDTPSFSMYQSAVCQAICLMARRPEQSYPQAIRLTNPPH